MEFGKLFPQLANVHLTHRWGGLPCFTADIFPMIGMFDLERRIYGIAGYCGRGNCHSDIAAELLAGKAAGVKSEVEQRFGPLIEKLMAVGRDSANWGPWSSVYTEN